MINKQEIEQTQKMVEQEAQKANFTVNSQPTFDKAKEVLSEIKATKKTVKEKKEGVTKPLNEALKNVRDLFRPIEDLVNQTELHLKSEIQKYNNKLLEEQKKREEEAEQKLKEAEATGEKVDMNKITKKVENNQKKVEQIKTRKVKKLRIKDETKIPRSYLIPDEKMIKEALQAGFEVDGCELYEEEIIVNNY